MAGSIGASHAPKPPSHDSLERLTHVYEACRAIGVRTEPFWIRRPLQTTAAPPAAAAEHPPQPQDVLIVPLQSWYHSSWDCEPALASEESDERLMLAAWSDFRNCLWPPSFGPDAGVDDGLAEHFARMNAPVLSRLMSVLPSRVDGRSPPPTRLDKAATYARFGEVANGSALWKAADEYFTSRPIDSYVAARARIKAEAARRLVPRRDVELSSGGGKGSGGPTAGAALEAAAEQASRCREQVFVVSLSHFLPRQELLPEKRALIAPLLHRVSGSVPLERQLRQLMPDAHVFGHSHLSMDSTIEGIRYLQWPLGSPREQQSQTRLSSFGMLCLYDGADGGEAPQHWTHWGRHYEEFERDLSRTEVMPYLKGRGTFVGGTACPACGPGPALCRAGAGA